MSLLETLNADLKAAMLAKDTVTRDTLRMVLTLTKNLKIELGRELTDDDVLGALQRGVKTRRDSIEQYQAAGRDELAEVERTEIAVLEVEYDLELRDSLFTLSNLRNPRD